MADDLEMARRRRQQRRAAPPAGAFGPGRRKREAIDRVMARVDAAAIRRDPAAYWAGKTPVPQRITSALDILGMYGPQVDEALGGAEPMVDEWESGERVPSFTQVQALAKLTGFPVRFFYMPPPAPVTNGWICGPGGCQPLGESQGQPCTCGSCPVHG
jgi:hypothetical protein